MGSSPDFILNLLLIYCCVVAVSPTLIITGKKCGIAVCNTTQYCNLHDDSCRSCADICDKNSPEFGEHNCVTNCQNYLYDLQIEEKLADIRGEIQALRNTVSLLIALICLVLVILGVLFFVSFITWLKKHRLSLAWLRKKLKLKEKQGQDATIPPTISSGRPDLRLEMPTNTSTPSVNGNTPSTTTTTISRRPTEDTTLDYAYDNPVIMIGTPSPHPPPHESSL